MSIELPKDIHGHQTKIVEKKDTAVHYGSGSAEVFATPALIALMEKTAFLSIESHLTKGFSSVGIEINVKHIKASLPGAIITCISKIRKQDGKKVFFTITAEDESGVIGIAEHTRYIINSDEFMARLNK